MAAKILIVGKTSKSINGSREVMKVFIDPDDIHFVYQEGDCIVIRTHFDNVFRIYFDDTQRLDDMFSKLMDYC